MKPMILIFPVAIALFFPATGIAVDTVHVDLSVHQGELKRYERQSVGQGWVQPGKEFELLDQLHIETVRIAQRPARYPVYGEDFMRLEAAPIFCIWGFPDDLQAYEDSLYANFLRLKLTDFPDMVYVEVGNEPDIEFYEYRSPREWTGFLEAAGRAAERVNREIPPGLPRLKVGGPTTHDWNPEYLLEVLEEVHSRHIPMDFLCWHKYREPFAPATIGENVDTVDRWLEERGMQLEKVITEWSWWPGGNVHDPGSDSLLKTAAYMAAGNYFWEEKGVEVVCQWVVRHHNNWYKSQFAGTGREGYEGKVYPFYNMLKMRSMMRTQRVQACFTGMDGRGNGTGSLASYDGTGITVMLWNHEGGEREVELVIDRIPGSFGRQPCTINTYVIDDRHSNFAFDPGKDRLECVSTVSCTPGNVLTRKITMRNNAVVLVEVLPAVPSCELLKPLKPHRPFLISEGEHAFILGMVKKDDGRFVEKHRLYIDGVFSRSLEGEKFIIHRDDFSNPSGILVVTITGLTSCGYESDQSKPFILKL